MEAGGQLPWGSCLLGLKADRLELRLRDGGVRHRMPKGAPTGNAHGHQYRVSGAKRTPGSSRF